jgi:hypothetical protein
LVSTVVTLAGSIKATLDDPDFAIRGIMRFGTGSAEGVNEIRRENYVKGGAKIALEVFSAMGMAAGGVAGFRALGAPRNPNLPGSFTNSANRAFYGRFEQAAATTLDGPLADVATQVTVQPLIEAPPGEIGPQLYPARVRVVNGNAQATHIGGKPLTTRIDAVERSRLTAKLAGEEAKSTDSAPLTQGQRLSHPLLERNGGIVRGQNGAPVGLSPGDPVGPLSVRIVRPQTFYGRIARPVAGAAAAGSIGTASSAAKRDEPRPIP